MFIIAILVVKVLNVLAVRSFDRNGCGATGNLLGVGIHGIHGYGSDRNQAIRAFRINGFNVYALGETDVVAEPD